MAPINIYHNKEDKAWHFKVHPLNCYIWQIFIHFFSSKPVNAQWNCTNQASSSEQHIISDYVSIVPSSLYSLTPLSVSIFLSLNLSASVLMWFSLLFLQRTSSEAYRGRPCPPAALPSWKPHTSLSGMLAWLAGKATMHRQQGVANNGRHLDYISQGRYCYGTTATWRNTT